jgi:hypothetical protein
MQMKQDILSSSTQFSSVSCAAISTVYSDCELLAMIVKLGSGLLPLRVARRYGQWLLLLPNLSRSFAWLSDRNWRYEVSQRVWVWERE